jgi:uncharacterized protein involved in cysteine biosynthesis
MRDILIAYKRSIQSLLRPSIFMHVIWPGLVSALVWLLVAVFSWSALNDFLKHWVTGWIGSSSLMAGPLSVVVGLLVALVFILLFYLSSMLLLDQVALPIILERVTERDYADLERRRGGTSMGSLGNTVRAAIWYVLILLVSIPFWWIPGVALFVPLFATGWLNQRIFGYDALMTHADRDELARLRKTLRFRLFWLGSGTALLIYIPILNIAASAFSSLAYVHYLLEVLRRERGRP